jgi:CheY-like chemotaxis protein
MSPANILICECEAIIALEIQETLRDLGHEAPVVVCTGEEAVKVAYSMKPSLFLTEVQLAGKLDGIAAASLIRSGMDVPVIYLASGADEITVQSARATRPYGFLLKPFSTRQLEVTIEMALHNHRSDLMVNRLNKSGLRFADIIEDGSTVEDRVPVGSMVPDLPMVAGTEAMLPICSCCKQIRDNSGSWRRVEEYFATHFDLLFTHSLCPECVKKFVPQENGF